MFSRLRFFLSDVRFWLSQRLRRNPKPSAPELDRGPAGEPEADQAPGAAQVPEATPAPEALQVPDAVPAPKKRTLRRPPRPRLRRPSIGRPQLRRPHIPQARLPSRRVALAFLGGFVIAAGAAALLIALDPDIGGSSDNQGAGAAPAPRVVIHHTAPQNPPELGFPEFASKNTTRIAGADPVSDSVGAALAAFPSTGGVDGPDAVTMVSDSDWASGVAASVLVADPIRAPILVGQPDQVPALVLDSILSLAPPGSSATGDAQLFRVGDVAAPSGLRTRDVQGGTPAEVAAGVLALRQRLTDTDPEHIVLASSDDPAFAMPAAAWAARSGDPVLFVQKNTVPQATIDALKLYPDLPVFLLGPESVISNDVITQLGNEGIHVVDRISGPDPVQNAIAFARYSGSGGFGWNIVDPGHGLVVANDTRPADAGAAAVLSASGSWGPLLLITSADQLPPSLQGFLLDIKPGYVDDPTRAVYNHVWLIGDPAAISVDVQAQIDDLAELAQVQSGGGQPQFGVAPTAPEGEPRSSNGSTGNSQTKP
jgi:hypothetical protein